MSIKKININGTQHDLIATSATTATKLNTAQTIDGVSFDGSANVTRYAICTTAANISAKIATTTSGTFKLDIGARVTVKFTNELMASGVTLNVNNTGAKTIHCGDANGNSYLTGNQYWEAGSVIDFVYDGTYWNMATTGYAANAKKASLDSLGNNIKDTYALKNQTGNCYCIDNSSIDELDMIVDHYNLTNQTHYKQNINYPAEPKEGDIILDIKGNAVYKFYPYPTSAVATVYLYRKMRNGKPLIGGGEYIGEVVGNFAGLSSNTIISGGNANVPSGQFNATDYKWFKNRGLALIGSFTMDKPFESSTSLFDAIGNYLGVNGTSNDSINDLIVIVDLVIQTSQNSGLRPSVIQADNGFALCTVPIKSTQPKRTEIDYWAADCWLDSGEINGNNYIVAPYAPGHIRLFYFEQYGGHSFNLEFAGGLNFHSNCTVVTPSASLLGSSGQWVYVGQINDEISYMRGIEANTISPSTVSGRSSYSYTTLVNGAKPGDIYIKTPSSILNLTNAQIWKCKYSNIYTEQQLWEKIFG